MGRSYVKELGQSFGKEVEVKGWVHKIHDLGRIAFVTLRDKTGLVQLVLDEKQKEGLRLEMALEVRGVVSENTKAVNGLEINVEQHKVVGEAHYDKLPFSVNRNEKTHLETQLNHRTISLRNPQTRAPFIIQEEIVTAFREYLKGEMFSEIHTPKIISSGTEGGSEMFTVKYFDSRAFLAQSPQFYKQMMVGAGFEKVFEIGHAYRSELHNTWRHLNEYVSLDVELGFIEDEKDIMDLEEGLLKHIIHHLNQNCKKELDLLGVSLPEIQKIPRIELEEAREILLKEYGKKSPAGNLDAEGEALFSAYIKEKYASEFVFLTRYPVSKRPVYTMPFEEEPSLTRSFDLIFKGLEITTGGQRIHNYHQLKENMVTFGLKPEDFDFYLETFRYGMPPHGGFAIGLERLTMKFCQLENIREATLLPRDMKRITP